MVTGCIVTFYPTPVWVAALTGTDAHNDSTLTQESYDESGGDFNFIPIW